MHRWLFLVLLLPAVLAPPSAAGERVALVVGNSEYGQLGRLANPVSDANGIRRLLEQRLGFRVILSLDADHDRMSKAFTEFGRAAAAADVALFFYAGHGIELDGANYLLPVGADIRTDVDLINQAYRLDQVVETMVRAGAKIKIVLVDACRNNPLPSQATRGARSIGLKAFYATNVDTLIAFAAEPGRVAYDGEGSNSPFTMALLENLATPGLEIQLMLRRVRNSVYAATREKQFPWWDDMFLSEVYLGGGAVPLGLADMAPAQGDAAADVAACERLGDKPSMLMMESYLERFPDGYCAPAIRKRLGVAAPLPQRPPVSLASPEPEPVSPGAPADSGSAPVVVEAVAAEPSPEPVVQPYSISSYWNHNGSVMALSAQGDTRVFYYEQPRELVAKAGVGRGTLLFKGKLSGRNYDGQAYLFSKRCGPMAYPVSGTVSEGSLRVELQGERPVRGDDCRQTGTKVDRLVFEYRSKNL